MFVADDDLEQMAAKIARFNGIRSELGLPPDQPTTLLWMYCAETEAEAEEGWHYYANQMRACSTTTSSGTIPASKASRAWSTT